MRGELRRRAKTEIGIEIIVDKRMYRLKVVV
jgi:hypothetical protein